MKNKSTKLFACILLLAACGTSDTPSEVFLDFMNALQNKKFEDARKLSSAETVKVVDLVESISKLQPDSVSDNYSQVEVIDERINGDTAYVEFIDPQAGDVSNTAKLIKSNGRWLVHITKQDISAKNAGFDEQEEDGFYEEDDYFDMQQDSMQDATVDSMDANQ
ncbi:MAG: hypothetical protein ACKOYC_00570 [Bacteroidota bacterium]